MNSVTKKLLLYIPTAGLGLWCMAMQSRILAEGYDEKGLLLMRNPTLIALWIVVGAFLLAVLAMLPLLGEKGTYGENFPRCTLSAVTMIAAALCLGFVGLNQLVPGMMERGIFAIVAAAAMGLCGFSRLTGQKPVFVLDLIVGVYYAVHLLWCYTEWNANPQLQRYAFQLLAGIAAMLFSLHRARCAAGVMDRRSLVFMGFAGMMLSFPAIPGGESVFFFLASGLWCAGGMCDLKKLKKPEKTAPEGE